MYQLEFKPSFVRDLERLTAKDAALRKRLWSAIDRLKEDPRPDGVKKLAESKTSYGALWRIRVGNYRIVYTIQDQQLLVLLLTLGDRKEVYR